MAATVLVVDDNEDVAELFSTLIRLLDYNAVTAYGGEEAVQKAIDYKPDLILMDIRMPGMDGFEATRRIHALPECASTPTVAVSAHCEGDWQARARLCTKSRRTDPLARFARVSPSARGRMTQQNERLYSPPRRGGEPPGAQRGGRGSVRRLFVQSRSGRSRVLSIQSNLHVDATTLERPVAHAARRWCGPSCIPGNRFESHVR